MKILVTGAAGFLGAYVARYFSSYGHIVFGCGRGNISADYIEQLGLSHWEGGVISYALLESLDTEFDVIIHCAGSGSVASSIADPLSDFQDSVDGTVATLEYIRKVNPRAHLIYPSSPAVHGVCKNQPISVDSPRHPVSPYGYHKFVSEIMCESYRNNFDIKVSIVRLFSVYGPGLRKQILWDACKKFIAGGDCEFWGDGQETRDFINVYDVARLFYKISESEYQLLPPIMNCGSGKVSAISDVLKILSENLDGTHAFNFRGELKAGDPRHYWADISDVTNLGWGPTVDLVTGLKEYLSWYKNQK